MDGLDIWLVIASGISLGLGVTALGIGLFAFKQSQELTHVCPLTSKEHDPHGPHDFDDIIAKEHWAIMADLFGWSPDEVATAQRAHEDGFKLSLPDSPWVKR
jgi:hypothetical protein